MSIRVLPFINGFTATLKHQMDAVDRELLQLFFREHKPIKFASPREKSTAEPAHYFRLGASHLNVLFPVWILNGKKSLKSDRFRIASTFDHSFILDVKESILYDPTTETLHAVPEYKPLAMKMEWQEETRLRFSDELARGRLKFACLSERVSQMPDVHKNLADFIMKRKLKNQFPDFKFEVTTSDIWVDDMKARVVLDLAMEELLSRANNSSAFGRRAG